MPRGFAGESERQEARTIGGGPATEATRAAVARGRESVQRSMDRNRERQAVAEQLGITDDNPYGNMSGLSRALGAENVSYAGNMSLNQRRGIANLMIDRYLDPVNPATGRVRPGLDAGDPTRYGPVESDPSLRRSYGIMSAFPGVGLLTGMFDKSALTVPGFTGYQDAADVVAGPAPEPLSLEQAGVVGPESAFSDQRLSEFDDLVSEVLTRSDAIIADTAPQAGPVPGYDPDTRIPGGGGELDVGPFASDFYYTYSRPEQTTQPVSATTMAPDIPSPVPVPTELTFTNRTTVADPSRVMTLPPVPAPVPAPTPGATSQLLGDAYYQQARRELEEDQRRRGDRIDFMLDLLEAAPKAFEPRFTAPSVPAPPPPVFGEQVDLANPATFGLTGFRP